MPTFTYVARNAAGTSRSGEVSAPSEIEAARVLRGEGNFVVELKEQQGGATATAPASRVGGRVRFLDVLFFTQQMAMMIETGVPVAEALDGIIRQSSPGKFRRILEDLRGRVESGVPLSVALARYPRAFGAMYVNLIRASEASGTLGSTLSRLGSYLEGQREVIGQIRGAMLYPAVLLTLSIAAVAFVLTYILPKFMVLYKGREALLPTPTKILLASSHVLTAYWPFWIAGLVGGSVMIVAALRTSAGRRAWDWLYLNFPLLGAMARKALLTRSLHTLGTLIDSGVQVLDSVAITKRVVPNHYFAEMWDKVDEELQRGRQLSAPLYRSKLCPRPIVQMIEAGERSGQLGSVLKRIATFMEKDLRAAISAHTRLIEPVMIMFTGVIIGGIALALLLPIFTLSRNIGKF